MSDSFDSTDPFADFTADDLDLLENAALAATQASQSRYPPPLPRTKSFQNAFPEVQEESSMEDDYGLFNVDDDYLLVDEVQAPPPIPSPHQSRFPTNINQTALMEELAYLRAKTSRLKLERDKLETLAYTQDGKMDYLQRTLLRTRQDHEAALQRVQRSSEAEKRSLQNDLADRERKLNALTADIEFQRNELREARDLATRGGVIRPSITNNNEELLTSPKKPARVVKGSGVKSPELKTRIGVLSARAFGNEESVGLGKINDKKRKREEPRMITPEPVIVHEELSDVEINRIVMEKVLRERSTWTGSDERFELMHDILVHRMEGGIETFMILSSMTFKSDDHAISSILIHEITSQARKAENEDALADLICDILSQQWNRCLKEEVYTPLVCIQSLLNYLLLRCYRTCGHCLTFTPSPIHLAQSTVELHASKRIYNKDTPQLPYATVVASLDVLYTIACGLPTSNDITNFWEILSVNFTIMVLHTKQLVNTIEGMSRLLEVSITTNGFGPRGAFEDEGVQRDPVALVLDKLTLNLTEEPRAGCTREELWCLRQVIVQTMSELVAGHVKGSKILHDSGFVVPRLIRSLANEIEYYYAHPQDSEQSIVLSKSCVRLLHAIIMPHSPDTLSHFLSPYPGAQQAHNVAMTRLSFGGESETVFVDVADMARDLLEAAVSPEEGDGIWSLFQWGEDDEMDDIGDVDDVADNMSEFMD